ncbi:MULTISPECIES: SUF system Fe-S cluster assembly protein [unclassified Commensalibacter]|uniref:SUF system Fe-S cluster assembly protein n=1 Tax=unclassified Commensalibacter TaxID=2630218 RepID=UPI0018DB29ED|nr:MULTISPECIES: SUF system Fe-S cluster assembly protein [unclassified Commensalibacter]MBH9970012.1 SUF system Fe-S cluster assembly protein [Commensalibacter sp. M0265]MBH9977092.1 SUF system Fe-S cluster assembly protein [Commensalibacter sp. M0266]MBH9993047.1 SUF system Fe-S cluster assembly protein [Commensalibacter sp. M0270]MBI0046268.1 SUF system Fe-S cluster assembly protein [Commensalibacter sp. M0267]MBI0056212.1 SUF system Fe-S cluster assembly protein [Commensalibacter sp. M0268
MDNVDQKRSDNIGKAVSTSESDVNQENIEAWKPEDNSNPQINNPKEEIDENAIIDAVSTIYDPEIPVNVYDLGLIYAIDLHDDGKVQVEMTLTAPNCPSAQELPLMVQQAIEKVKGVTEVKVEIVWDPPWDPSRMSDEARLTLNMF